MINIKSILKSFGTGIIVTLGCSVLLINSLTGIVGFIWLLIEKKYPFIFTGIIEVILMPWAFSLASLVPISIGALGIKLFDKKSKLTFPILLLSMFFQYLIFAGWLYWVDQTLLLPMSREVSTLLLFLWGYAVTLNPIQYMASKEAPDSLGTALGTLFMIISFFVYSTEKYIFGYNVETMIFSISVLAILFITFALLITIYEIRHKRKIETLLEIEG